MDDFLTINDDDDVDELPAFCCTFGAGMHVVERTIILQNTAVLTYVRLYVCIYPIRFVALYNLIFYCAPILIAGRLAEVIDYAKDKSCYVLNTHECFAIRCSAVYKRSTMIFLEPKQKRLGARIIS